jgi:hypothetical protein
MRRLSFITLLAAVACNAQQVTSFDGVSEEEIRGLFYFHHSDGISVAPGPSGHGFLLSRPNAPPLGLTAYHVAGPIGGPLQNPAEPACSPYSEGRSTLSCRFGWVIAYR